MWQDLCWVLIFQLGILVSRIHLKLFKLGMCVGSLVLAIPIYISDIAEKNIRGTLAATSQAINMFGILISFLIGSHLTWYSAALTAVLFPCLFFNLVLTVPESPRFHLLKAKGTS